MENAILAKKYNKPNVMKLKFTLFIIFCFFFSGICITEAATDKYRLIIRNDPSNSVVIGWNQISGANSTVYYDTIDHGTTFSAYAFSHGVDRAVNSRGMDNNFSRLTGLLPNKVYYFVIVDDNSTSLRYSFRTAPNVPTERLCIIGGGDSRSNQAARRNGNLMVAKLRVHAVLFGGDMTEFDSNGEWQTWFDDWQLTIATDGRMTALIPTRGNHEYSSSVVQELFDVISPDIYFANTFGGNLFRAYTLNSNIATGGAQATWLQGDLQSSANVIWKAAQYHHPMRPHTSSKPERNDIYTDWLPLFELHGMNFAIECDAHVVKHTYAIKGSTALGSDEGFIRNDLNGIVYIGEGCWGAPTRAADDGKDWTREMGSFNQFHLIYIDINRVEIRAVGVDNATAVGQLDDNTRFTLASNIDIWQAATGNVIVIENYRLPGRPNVSLVNPLNGQSFGNLNTIPFIALASDTDSGSVDSVQFFVNGMYVGTATSANNSFRFDWTPNQSGLYSISAKAFDNDGKMNHTAGAWITVFSNNTTVVSTVQQGSDDAEQYINNTLNTTSVSLDLCDDIAAGHSAQLIGIRFANLGIPQGANIINAYIQFTSSGTSSGLNNLNIRMQDHVHGLTFSGIGNISSRTSVLGTISWSPPNWNTAGQAGIDQQTPNLSSLLQQVVNKAAWAAGNAAVFVISGSGQRIATSFEAGNAPRLVVEYSLSSNNFPGNLQVQINNSSDDAEESSLGITNTTSNDLDMVYEFGLGNQRIGLRFNNITIPPRSIIESAYIQFYAIDASSGSTTLNIKVQDNVNPATFDAISINNISGRPTMATTLTWLPNNWNMIGESDTEQRTPNLAALLQSIIDKNGWLSGNSVAFIITGNGERDAATYDEAPAKAPILVVNYRQSFPPITATQVPDLVICNNGAVTADASNNYRSYYWNNDISEGQLSTLNINISGIYTLRVMDSYGQVAQDTFSVTMGQTAVPNLGSDLPFTGQTLVLSVGGGPFVNYHWSNGANSASIGIVNVGIYTVTVTNASGCTGTDQVIVYQASGLNQFAQMGLELYPNPAKELVNIRIDKMATQDIDMQIIDVNGRMLMRRILPAGQNLWVLDLEGLPMGTYWMRLLQNNREIGVKSMIKT